MFYHSPNRVEGQPLVELRNVSKRFSMHRESQRSLQEALIHLVRRQSPDKKSFWPLKDISFAIYPGQSVGLIGPNGSGKSTLLKVITGILEPTAGDIAIRGRVSSLLELGAGFHPDLTGRENIFLNGAIFGMSSREMRRRVDSIIDFAELGDFIDVPIKHYSSGMYVRLGFAVAIHTDPDLLVVDEVLAVGDTAFQHKCLNSIQEFRANGGTLLLVSHDLSAIQTICREAIWLDRGHIQAQGAPLDVTMAYLNQVADQEEAAAHGRPAPKLDGKRRWGTGRVRITGVELCDEKGDSCVTFVDGSTLEIRMHYHAAERIVAPVFGLAIHHQNGTHICGPNTQFGRLPIPEIEGDGVVVYRIPHLPLLEGAYQVSVAATNASDTEMYDYHDRAYPFLVYPGKSGERYGVVTLGGEWQWRSGSDVDLVLAESSANDPSRL